MSKQRYEKEIEEILQKFDQESGRDRKPRPERPLPESFRTRGTLPQPPSKQGLQMPNWRRLSAGQYIALAFGAAILAIFVRGIPVLPTLLILLAVVLFLMPVLLYYVTGTSSGGYSPREEKRWRGQVIDFDTRRNVTDDPLAGIKRWLRRR